MPSRDDEIVAKLEQDAKALREKLENIRKPIEEDLQHILGTIAFYQRKRVKQVEPLVSEGATPLILRGLTHSQAVVAIAKHQGGIVKAQDAKRMMIKAGIMSQTKTSTNMAHNAILRTHRFERIAPGEYKLKEFPMERVNGNGQIFETPTTPPWIPSVA